MALAENIITFVMPGFSGDQLRLAAELLRILSPTVFFLVLANLFTTIYQEITNFRGLGGSSGGNNNHIIGSCITK